MTEFGPLSEDEALIREATAGIDDLALRQGASDQYPLIPGDEIVAADESYPLRGVLSRLANEELTRGKLQAEGEVDRERKNHDAGWSIVIDTDRGFVSLWSCWLGDQLELSYDGEELMSEEIREELEVEDARPVAYPYGGGARQWGRFYGPELQEGGRVWITVNESDSAPSPRFIDDNDRVERLNRPTNRICTFPFSFHDEDSPESPSTSGSAIQEYKEKFIHLAAKLAFRLGRPRAVSTEFSLMVMTPEELEREGYDPHWVKGQRDIREGWGSELVVGRNGDETIALESANSMVPWVNIRRLEVDKAITDGPSLAQRIIDEDLYF